MTVQRRRPGFDDIQDQDRPGTAGTGTAGGTRALVDHRPPVVVRSSCDRSLRQADSPVPINTALLGVASHGRPAV